VAEKPGVYQQLALVSATLRDPTNNGAALRATYAKLVAVPAIWGGTFIAGRILALALPAAVGSLLHARVAVTYISVRAWYTIRPISA